MGDIYTNPPQSRNEAILRATIDGVEYTAPPQSRIEDLLLELKAAIEGGGGGTTVIPNPTGTATDTLDTVQIGSTIYDIPEGTDVEANPQESATETLNKIGIGDTVYSVPNGGGGVTSYADLTDQPQVNSHTLIGNQSGADLGLVDAVTGYGLSQNNYSDADAAAVAALGTAASKDSTNAVTQSSTDLVESGAVYTELANKVSKSQTSGLLKNDGSVNTTIEGAVSANTSAISGIKDGQSIDSFADVESALADKTDLDVVATEFSSSTLYATGSHTIYNGELYVFNTAHNGAWTGSDVSKVTVMSAVDDKADKSKAYLTNDNIESTLDDADYVPFYDTSATAKRKTLWSNIKSVLKTYFDTLYNKITVAISTTGTASSSAFRKQVITIDNVSTDIDGSAYMEQSVTLSTSAAVTCTFTNAAIDDGAMLTLATSLWNLVPDDITLASGSCTITLPKWATAETIGVRLYVR